MHAFELLGTIYVTKLLKLRLVIKMHFVNNTLFINDNIIKSIIFNECEKTNINCSSFTMSSNNQIIMNLKKS